MDVVYVLWYAREWDEGEDTELLIGVYRSHASATEAIMRLRDQPGFRAYPEGFVISPCELNKDHWTEGYARMLNGRNLFDEA